MLYKYLFFYYLFLLFLTNIILVILVIELIYFQKLFILNKNVLKISSEESSLLSRPRILTIRTMIPVPSISWRTEATLLISKHKVVYPSLNIQLLLEKRRKVANISACSIFQDQESSLPPRISKSLISVNNKRVQDQVSDKKFLFFMHYRHFKLMDMRFNLLGNFEPLLAVLKTNIWKESGVEGPPALGWPRRSEYK